MRGPINYYTFTAVFLILFLISSLLSCLPPPVDLRTDQDNGEVKDGDSSLFVAVGMDGQVWWSTDGSPDSWKDASTDINYKKAYLIFYCNMLFSKILIKLKYI